MTTALTIILYMKTRRAVSEPYQGFTDGNLADYMEYDKMKYTIQRYVCIETTVEAETPEEALEKEEALTVEGTLTSPNALAFDWWISDAIGSTVSDDEGEICLENW